MKKSAKPSGPSQRALRVGELVRHAVAELLARGEVVDPVLAAHLVTIPEARMSPDLKLATIYVQTHAASDEKAVLAALDRNKRMLRHEVAQRLDLKFAPDLRFRRDERLDKAARIDALLRSPEVRRDIDSGKDQGDDHVD